jgi:phage tail sheath protein FI
MASTYKTPGVYIEEISKFPPSIAQVDTAIPAFIGYTEMAKQKLDDDLRDVPTRITSLLEYEQFFGFAQVEKGITVAITENPNGPATFQASIVAPSKYLMYYSLQIFFANGGGPCYIVSVGGYLPDAAVIDPVALTRGLNTLRAVDEVTLLVFPDGQGMASAGEYYALQKEALDQCFELQDRFAVMDVWNDPDPAVNDVDVFRAADFGPTDRAKYGAAYYPNLETRLDYRTDPALVAVTGPFPGTLAALQQSQNAYYYQAISAINQMPVVLPPSPAVVGVYAQVDAARGVWKAPANVGIDYAIRPTVKITDREQGDLNVDVNAGKSINAIRSFTGRGPAIIWGARTLAGNDNEWRYVSVRRFFNMVEESVKKATNQFVFEPNDANTWTKVKSMIENFLVLQWRTGALAGAVPEQAFYVKVGLNETMTALDVLEGRMIVEIGMAAVRPAEFIILRFSHKMQES